MAEAEILPSVLDLLHLDEIFQAAWTVPLYGVTWYRHAWPLNVAFGYIGYVITDVTPYVAEILLETAGYVATAAHRAVDVIHTLVVSLPEGVLARHDLLAPVKDLVVEFVEVVVGALQTAKPFIYELCEETFFILAAAVELLPSPIQVVSLVVRSVAWMFRPLYVLLSVFVVPSLRKWFDFLVYLTPTSDDLTVLLLRLPLWADTALLYALSALDIVPELPSIISVCDRIPLPDFLDACRAHPRADSLVVPLPDFVQDVPNVRHSSSIEVIPDPTDGAIIIRQPNHPTSFFVYI